MDWFRFFRKAKYIKKLEDSIEYYEKKKITREEWIKVQRREIELKDSMLIDLSKKISELKKTPPEPKLASNIDLSDPIFQKMIKAGRSALVKKAHPDHGGSREKFEKVENAYEMLKGLKIQPQERAQSGLNALYGYGFEAEYARMQRAAQSNYRGY